MDVSRLIGRYKKEHNVAILQAGRWEQLLADMVEKGAKMGLSETSVRAIMTAIHDESVRVQNEILES
jgi:chorismate mutase